MARFTFFGIFLLAFFGSFNQIRSAMVPPARAVTVPVPLPPPCGPQHFNVTTQLCCEGIPFSRPPVSSNLDMECCGRLPFNPKFMMCCNQLIVPLPLGPVASNLCCGNFGYNTVNQLCCNGLPQPIISTLKCCGSVLFNPETQICCNGFPQPIGSGNKCCGNLFYNSDNQICCNGFPQPLGTAPNMNRCCDTLFFDPKTQICCTDRVYPLGSSTSPNQCCGSNFYIPESQACCVPSNEVRIKGGCPLP